MTSPFSDELLSAYLDGELNAEERAYVEAQLRERVELRRLCDELRALRATLRAMPVARPPENFAERVLRQAERQMLADTAPATDQPATIEAPSEETVELRRRSFLDNPKWRIGIGAVAAIAACAVAMVFLAPPTALQTTRSVAVAPDAISLPTEGMTDLASRASSGPPQDGALKENRNLLVRGRTESMDFADGVSAPKSVELRLESVSPSAPEPTPAATPAAPARHDEQPTGGQASPQNLAAGEADMAVRRMRVEERPAAPTMAESALSEARAPAAPGAGAGSSGALGDRGGSAAPSAYGATGGGLGGGMGSGMSGMGGVMGGVGGEAEPGAAGMQPGKAIDAPTDATPPSAPAATTVDDLKNLPVAEFGRLDADAVPANRYFFALPLDRDAWLGRSVTAESMEQCAAQLDQARFLLVKVSAPENAREEVAAIASSDFYGGESAREELSGTLRSRMQQLPQLGQVSQESEPTGRESGSDAPVRQQILVVDASSEMIRQSIDQLVSQPEVSVELATSDSAVAKQLADQQLSREPGNQATMPSLAAQPQDPAPAAARPAESTTALAETVPADGVMSPHGQSAGKPAATPTAQDAAKKRVVFYVLYRLLPEPVPPSPADDASGR